MSATRFYHPRMLAAEHEIAAQVRRMMKNQCQIVTPILDGLDQGNQSRAVQLACTCPVSYISGRPGTGKTTTTEKVIRSYDAAGMRGMVMAPAAKAAKRSAEVVNYQGATPLRNALEFNTVHKGLEFSPRCGGFSRCYDNPLDLDYVVLDEGSMLDLEVGAGLFTALDPSKTRIVIVGDPYQLPSVAPGNVMNDMILSGIIPGVELKTVYRTGENSGIAKNAARILEGLMPEPADEQGVKYKDFYFVPRDDPKKTVDFILDSVCVRIPAQRGVDATMDIQVLSPGKKGICGTKALNDALREILNPPNGTSPSVTKGGIGGFRKNDKIIIRKNNRQFGVVNGDVGKVIESGAKGLTIDMGLGAGVDGSGVIELTGDDSVSRQVLESIFLAYCYTVHSSQGSEYKVVLMPLHMMHYTLMFRNLLYTGVTRAKNLSCVVGDIKALRHAVETSVTDKRITGLQNWLRHYAAMK